MHGSVCEGLRKHRCKDKFADDHSPIKVVAQAVADRQGVPFAHFWDDDSHPPCMPDLGFHRVVGRTSGRWGGRHRMNMSISGYTPWGRGPPTNTALECWHSCAPSGCTRHPHPSLDASPTCVHKMARISVALILVCLPFSPCISASPPAFHLMLLGAGLKFLRSWADGHEPCRQFVLRKRRWLCDCEWRPHYVRHSSVLNFHSANILSERAARGRGRIPEKGSNITSWSEFRAFAAPRRAL